MNLQPSKHTAQQAANDKGDATGRVAGLPKNAPWLVAGIGGGLVLIALLISAYMAVATDGSLPAIACSFFGVLAFGLVFIVPIGLFVMLLTKLSSSAERTEQHVYESFAKMVNGRVFKDRRFGGRHCRGVQFSYRQCPVLINSELRRGADHYDQYSCFTIDLPRETHLQCKISPQHILDLGRMFGGQDVVLGWPVFDDAFRVKTNNEPLAMQLLDTTFQQHMLSFREFGKTIRTNVLENGRVWLYIEPRQVRVVIQGVISKEEEIFEFFRRCKGMIDHLAPRLI